MSVIAHRAKREHVYFLLEHRDGPDCFYCKRPFQPRTSSSTAKCRTLDHDVPKVRGGTGRIDNLRMCCGKCNHAKGEMTGEEFLRSDYLRRVGFWTQRDEMKKRGLHPKGGYWHSDIVRTSPLGSEVILKCNICGQSGDTEHPLMAFPCVGVVV